MKASIITRKSSGAPSQTAQRALGFYVPPASARPRRRFLVDALVAYTR